MPSCWPTRIERAKPWLGTTVVIRVEGLAPEAGQSAVSAAFEMVARVHRLMSFQEPGSELSCLNREAADKAVTVSLGTAEVLAEALRLAAASHGAFDPTIAGALVKAGALPRPAGAPDADLDARWTDVELDGTEVRFRRPLWLDLSGMAKGYAVDRACEALASAGASQGAVNAGGDLRLFGPRPEAVVLDSGDGATAPALELQDGAVASSGRLRSEGDWARHVDPRSGRVVDQDRFAAVIAPSAMTADALTKPVLLLAEGSAPLLAAEGAWAVVGDADGWRAIGEAP